MHSITKNYSDQNTDEVLKRKMQEYKKSLSARPKYVSNTSKTFRETFSYSKFYD